MTKLSEDISAAAALSKIAEIRQYGLLESYAHLAAMETVQRINANAREATGIDLLNSNYQLTFDEIDKYEAYLDTIVAKNLPIILNDSFLAEGIDFLENIDDQPPSIFSQFNYTSNSISNAVKGVFKSIGISAPSILPILKTPIRVQKYNGAKPEFFSLSKFTWKSKTVYVLFHVDIGLITTASFGNNQKLSDIVKKARLVSDDNNILSATTCFFFKEETAYNQSPANLFLKAIEKYGQTSTIGNSSKKYHNKVYSSKLLITDTDNIKLMQDVLGVKGSVVSGHISVHTQKTGYQYENLYFLYAERMERDYSNRQFQ